ncbi:MAG: O-antigen ligase family protein [Sedimentisphaerales bacterium]
MYTGYETVIPEADIAYVQSERTSDIKLPPAMNILLLALWAVICLIGFAVIFLGKNTAAGIVIIAVPTFIGMVMKPTFALCIMMLVLPTGAGIGVRQDFSLDRGVGIAVAISFALNLLITRPPLRIGNKALWVIMLYTIWVFLVSLAAPYLGLELRRAFTQVQLLVLVFIVYWILQTNDVRTFHWALRAYVLGTLGTITLAFVTGTAIRTIEETPEARYSATLGEAIDANMLAGLTSLAFLAAIYLFARDKKILWRIVYLVAMLVLPIMLLRIGSRGALIAIAFTMLSPLLFLRQVLRRPTLTVLLLVVILLASVSAGLVIKTGRLESGVAERLTDIHRAKDAISYRMMPIKQALRCVVRKPAGTSYFGWFEHSGLLILPHNDFFLALGIYGIPAAGLFTFFVIMLILTVKRIPLGWEKLYARAVLTFLLVMGLNVGQLYQKHFWVFLVFVMASERIAEFLTPATDELVPYTEYEEDLLPAEFADARSNGDGLPD